MAKVGPVTSKWDVRWSLTTNREYVGRSLVVLSDGYSTMNDIPKILAIKAGIDPGQVYISRMDRIEI